MGANHDRNGRQAREVLTLYGVRVNRRATGQALLVDVPFGSKLAGKDPSPALVGAKSASVIDMLHGNSPMGIRVAKADKCLGQVLLASCNREAQASVSKVYAVCDGVLKQESSLIDCRLRARMPHVAC